MGGLVVACVFVISCFSGVLSQDVQIPYGLRGVPASPSGNVGVLINPNPGQQSFLGGTSQNAGFPLNFAQQTGGLFQGTGSSNAVFQGTGPTGSSGAVFQGTGPTGSSGVVFQGTGPTGSSGAVFQGTGPVFQNVGQNIGPSGLVLGSGIGNFQQSSPSLTTSVQGVRVAVEQPDITITTTVTLDRFVTTTDVAFITVPVTATVFTLLTRTVATTVVLRTPVDQQLVVSTTLITRHPAQVTVTDVQSQYRYNTNTDIRYVTITHTSYRISQETSTTTITNVGTVATTVTHTTVLTNITTVTGTRIVTSTVLVQGYY